MGAALKIIDQGADSPLLSLELPKEQSFEEWTETGRNLAAGSKVLNWWIGDWWAAGTHRYGARAQVAAEGIFGREFQSLANMASVCRAFTTSRRREHLSFSHHAEVAGLSPAKADALLDRAERENWSVRDIRAESIIAREHTPRWFEAKPPTQYDREKAKEAVFAKLEEAAKVGAPCPSAEDLAEVAGVESISTTVALMHVLEREGRITVDRFQKGRTVVINATGDSTAEPANQTPHWRDIAREVPTPTVDLVAQRQPSARNMIFALAKRQGKSPQDYMVDLILLGLEVVCASDDSISDEFGAGAAR